VSFVLTSLAAMLVLALLDFIGAVFAKEWADTRQPGGSSSRWDCSSGDGTKDGGFPTAVSHPVRNRDRLNRCLDRLPRAGEDVPPWLDKHGPVDPGALRSRRTGDPVDAISLASLCGKTREARDLFDREPPAVPPPPASRSTATPAGVEGNATRPPLASALR